MQFISQLIQMKDGGAWMIPISTLVFLSEIHFDNRAYAKALPLLEEARRQQPDHHGVAMNLGLAYRGVGRFDDSKRLYEEAIAIEGANPDPYLNLGILFGDYMKRYGEAVQAFNTYISKGGMRRTAAQEYIAKVEKEQSRADKKKLQDSERKKRDAERAERERLLKEAEEKAKKEADAKTNADPWGAPSTATPSDSQPNPTPPPPEEESDSPWEMP